MKYEIAFVGPLPGPVSGLSLANRYIVHELSEKKPIRIYDTSAEKKESSAARILSKLLKTLRVSPLLLRDRISGCKSLYMSVDGGFGQIMNLFVIASARLLGMKIFLHHHSFQYIVKKSALMSVLVRISGQKARHIFLCNHMNDQFFSLYRRAICRMTVPNAVETNNIPQFGSSERSAGVTIGMVSNLTFEKGVADFIALLEEAVHNGLDVRGVLAGPADGVEVERHIRSAVTRLGDRLEWLGPVYGEDKERFFERIDLFVFPTRYRTEAYPLVLVEALVRGRPIIAWQRGCIGALSELESATVIPQSEPFNPGALQKIAELLPLSARADAQRLAAEEGRLLNRSNEIAAEKLALEIVNA